MTTVRAALAAATAELATVGPTPRLDAELLMAHALGVGRDTVILAHMDNAAPPEFAALVARRLAHEPVAHLTGMRGFWTIDLEVGPGALIPRPDSETLIEAAIEHFADRSPATILDLGTGPGTLLLAALDQWPAAAGLGIERSDDARAYALRNAERLGLAGRADIRAGDWAAGIDRQFDLVLANPPYVATSEELPREVLDYEPAGALFGGPDGLDAYRVIAGQLPRLIAPGGVACIEIGWKQRAAVTTLLEAQDLAVACRRDLGGRDRCLVATLK